MHGSVSKAMIPDSEAEAESEAGGSGRKRVGTAIPKKTRFGSVLESMIPSWKRVNLILES